MSEDENEIFKNYNHPDFVVYEDTTNQNKQPMIGIIFSTTDNKQYMYQILLQNIDELSTTLTIQSLVETIYCKHPLIPRSNEMTSHLEKAAHDILKTSEVRKSKIKNEGSAQQPYSSKK